MVRANFLKHIQLRMAEIEEQSQVGYRENELGCFYCGTPLDPDRKGSIHSDHIHPKSKGGSNRDFIRVYVCEHCNLLKQAKTPAAWLRLVEDLPDEDAVDYVARILMGNLCAVFGFAQYSPEIITDYRYRVHGFVTSNSVSNTDNSECPNCHEHGGKMHVLKPHIYTSYRCDSCGELAFFLSFGPIRRKSPLMHNWRT